MRHAIVAAFVVLFGTLSLCADTGPEAPFFVTSPTGFGPLERGTIDSLRIDLGSTKGGEYHARIEIAGTSISPIAYMIEFAGKDSVKIGLAQLEADDQVLLTVEFFRRGSNTKIATATRDILFSWGFVGVSLDSASCLPFQVGTPRDITLQLTALPPSAPIDSFAIALVSPDTSTYKVLYSDTVIPSTYLITIPGGKGTPLGTMISVFTLLDDSDDSFHETLIELPIDPVPMTVATTTLSSTIGTNNYGAQRSLVSPSWPVQRDTIHISDLPDSAVSVALYASYLDGTEVRIDSVGPAGVSGANRVSIPIVVTDIDVRTAELSAKVFVKSIEKPFEVMIPIRIDIGKPKISVVSAQDSTRPFHFRQWNPHNNGTGTISAGTPTTLKVSWPLKDIDSAVVSYLSGTRQTLTQTTIPSDKGDSTVTVVIDPRYIPAGTQHIALMPFSDVVRTFNAPWDTTIVLDAPHPAFLFQRNGEFTSYGVYDVNDILTITDLPPTVDSVRLVLADHDSGVVHVDSTAVTPSIPYSGDVIFSGQAMFQLPSIVANDTVRTFAMFVRTLATDSSIILRWRHATGNELLVQCVKDGTLHATLGQDSIVTSAIIRDGAWHHIAIVVRDTAIALYHDASLQGTLRSPRWYANASSASVLMLGDGSRVGDTLFAATGVKAWAAPLGFSELQYTQVLTGAQSNALFSYPMNDGDHTAPTAVVIREEMSSGLHTIDHARAHAADQFAFSRFVLSDIGRWPQWSGQKITGQRSIDAYLTMYSGGTSRTDTVPGLVQIQSTTLTPDSIKCSKSTLYDSRLSSTEGWGPFNAFEPVPNYITYEGGYPWSALERSKEVERGENLMFSFLLLDNINGKTAQRVDVVYTPKMIKDSAAKGGNVIIRSPRPLMMDKVSDTTFYVSVLTNASFNNIEAQCLDISAAVRYEQPPPLPVSYREIGPFRQAKIWQGEHLWNTFTVYTEEAVENGVTLLVNDQYGELVHIVNATKQTPGVWTAKVDMADCEPPLAVVVAYSKDGNAIKRVSLPMHFAITPNRPAWLERKDGVIWDEPGREGDWTTAYATVATGAGLFSSLPAKLPIVGGFSLSVLPSRIKTKLLWNPQTNALDVSMDGGKISTDYAASPVAVENVQTVMTIINNTACFELTVLDGLMTTLKYGLRRLIFFPEGPDNPIGNINLNLQSADAERVKLDKSENLDVTTRMTQTVELYYLFNTNLFQLAAGKLFTYVAGSIQDVFEGPIQFAISFQAAPTLSAMGRLLIQDNVGTNDEGKWVPRGSLPVVMGDLNGPTLTGAGVSIDGGVSFSVQVLKGAGGITAYLTFDVDFAGALARIYESGKIVTSPLGSIGSGFTILVQTAEVWGAVQQTIYGPTTFLKWNWVGADLRDLYPGVDKSATSGESVQSSDPTPNAHYPVEALASMASPMPHSAQFANHTYSAWIDQDHDSKVGTLNLSVRKHGKDSIERIIRVEQNALSMVAPHVTPLSDTTVLVVWRQLDVDRASAAGMSFTSIHGTSDVHWSVVNAERSVVISSGRFRSSEISDPSLRDLVIESHPRAVRMSDTSASVVWMATDTAGTKAAVLSAELHGEHGKLAPTTVRSISVNNRDHRKPHVASDGNGGALATWIENTASSSEIYQSRYDGVNWSAPSRLEIGDIFVNEIDVADNGEAMVLAGMDHRDSAEHEVLMVIPRALSGLWDVENAVHVRHADREMFMRNPKIAVRGDSAMVIVRSQVSTTAHVNTQYHRMLTAVVDLQRGVYGTGTWVPTDSLSMIHDHDVQWEEKGVHVVVQEHLPIRGLHTNATLVHPFGAPQMNLAMHTITIADVITGIKEVTPTSREYAPTPSIILAPTPATSSVSVTAQTPFTRIRIYALNGAMLFDAYEGASVSTQTIDVDRLSAGTYLIETTDGATQRHVSLLRIAN